MANEHIFDHRAGNYSQGRPGYADGVTRLIFDRLLVPGGTVVDVGSGTGIFARIFLERGVRVVCVEPNAGMRAQADELFRGDPNYVSVAASAEATGLPDGCVDLMTAASAYHWFDPDAFAAECRRVLRPEGRLIKVYPGSGYLRELRAARNMQPYAEGQVEDYLKEKAQVLSEARVTYTLPVTAALWRDFVWMTPLNQDLSEEEKERLALLPAETVTVDLHVAAVKLNGQD